jgi:hypothetical protein
MEIIFTEDCHVLSHFSEPYEEKKTGITVIVFGSHTKLNQSQEEIRERGGCHPWGWATTSMQSSVNTIRFDQKPILIRDQ